MEDTGRCSSCFEPKGGPGACPACGWDAENPGLQSTQRLKPGTVLNGVYAVGKVLGQGGFGITYLAWDSHGGRKVAIKECFPDNPRAERTTDGRTVTCGGTDRNEKAGYEAAVAKFMQEASTLAQFYPEPEIVKVLSVFRENNTAYMVMEHLEGHSLGEEIRRKKRLPAERVEEVALSVCRGLKAVHGRGILHRDVSPDNIFVTDEGKIKLIDFGTARDMGGNRTLTVNLKHGYAPSEQYTGRDQGPWTDIYALGATLYRGLTGKLPPRSEEREVEDGIRSPSELGIELPERVEGAVMKALSVRIADRFQDVGEFAEALTGGEVSLEEPEEDGEDLYTQKTVWYRGPETTQEKPRERTVAEERKEPVPKTVSSAPSLDSATYTRNLEVAKGRKDSLQKPPEVKALKQVLNLPDGSKYEGEVVNGQPNGKGILTSADGERQEEEWVDGIVMEKTGNVAQESRFERGDEVAVAPEKNEPKRSEVTEGTGERADDDASLSKNTGVKSHSSKRKIFRVIASLIAVAMSIFLYIVRADTIYTRIGDKYRLQFEKTEDNSAFFKAEFWLKKGANLEGPVAMNNLAVLYLRVFDVNSAIYWLKKSLAINEDETTLYNLGYAHEIQGNTAEALRWYQKSADRGNKKAEIKVKEITKK